MQLLWGSLTITAERVWQVRKHFPPTSVMAAATLSGRPVMFRELTPKDLKLKMEQFSRREATAATKYLAGVVGKAHGRQMDADVRRDETSNLRSSHLGSRCTELALVDGAGTPCPPRGRLPGALPDLRQGGRSKPGGARLGSSSPDPERLDGLEAEPLGFRNQHVGEYQG